ncbi:acyltransferase [Streptomyces ferrugineus]|uniref:Acyltransferase n=1 Tax=Streptomyces ferrugineus TaxID=1413221 RepID=A0A7M2SVG0_9ACTN|nr:acyltransferase [Streptomyces ferrugineus]QOV40340.1 acyltransferase [Streptomyces ferrugineus]
MDHRERQSVQHFDHCPWLFAEEATRAQRLAQQERQRAVGGDTEIGERCYVADSAAVFPDRLRLGDDSYIAAHAYVTGELTTGTDCTLNPFTTVRGTVTLGDGVRIGAHSSVLGFNHSMAPDRPVFQQPLTSRGINVGDDVWIGSHVVVVDGVTIGDHCVVGAGAVVTRDLPAWTVAAGNPARPIRDRRDRSAGPAGTPGDVANDLTRFADSARAQAADILARCWDGDRYVDRPGAVPTMRAHCDAVEIADLLLGSAPPQLAADEHVQRLSAAQDPVSGLVPELGEPLPSEDDGDDGDGDGDDGDGLTGDGAALYHILSVGYALDLLGASFPHPVPGVREMTAGQLLVRLESLPWRDNAWAAGAWIDAWATAAHWNLRHGEGGTSGSLEALFGWLLTRADPWTGMWGRPSAQAGRLQVVNGYYRLTRGSFAQFGVPVPDPERVVDTVLAHAHDARHFGAGQENACNVLDVAHPLWMCSRQLTTGTGGDGYRSADIRAWAERQLAAVLSAWRDGQGFGFGAAAVGPGPEPGLQGTEMWLAIVWYLADLLGRSDALGYRPRGVHRPEPGTVFPAPPHARPAPPGPGPGHPSTCA